MRKRFSLASLAILVCLVTATQAFATPVLKTTSSPNYSSVNQPHFLGAVQLLQDKCVHFSFIMYSKNRWTKPQSPISGCLQGEIGQPVLTRDTKTGRLFIVWSAANIIHRNNSGVYYIKSSNRGATWTLPHQVTKLPKALLPVPVTAAARNNVLWVGYEAAPTTQDHGVVASLLEAPFFVYGYNGTSGNLITQNLTNKPDTYTANATQGSFFMRAAASGVFMTWQLTDAGGSVKSYDLQIADNRVHFDGDLTNSYPGTLTLITGEDNNVYLLDESRTQVAGQPQDDLSAYKYNFSRHAFAPLPGGALWDTVPANFYQNLLDKQLALSFQVSSSGIAYMAVTNYLNYTNGNGPNCFTGSYVCERTIVPNKQVPVNFILKRTRSGQESITPIDFSYPSYPNASTVTAWTQFNSGLDMLTSITGSMRYLMLEGYQSESANGAFTSAPQHEYFFSKAL